MTGHEYEYVVADYLKSKGYFNVKVTQASGDYGIDVLAQKGKHKYAVQCKYYSDPVGISAVQEAVAGMAMYKCDRAMVVTNSTFTRAAKELAEANNVILLSEIDGIQSGFIESGRVPIGCVLPIGLFCLFVVSLSYTAAGECFREGSYFRALGEFFSGSLFLIPIVAYIVWKFPWYWFKNLYPDEFKFWKKESTTVTTTTSTSEQQFQQTGRHTGNLDVSPIIGIPTKFTVLGEKYCLDHREDIQRFPLNFSSFEVNGQEYYFNTYFRMCADLYFKKGRSDLGDALLLKAQELENHPSYGEYLRSKVKGYIPSDEEGFEPVFLSCNPTTSNPWTEQELINALKLLKAFNQESFDILFEFMDNIDYDTRTLTIPSLCLLVNVNKIKATRTIYDLSHVGLIKRNGITDEYYFTASKDEIFYAVRLIHSTE